MKITPRIYLPALAITALLFAPASADALDSSYEAMSKSGTHQFYIVCSGQRDVVRSASGSNAEEAQRKLSRQAGNRCWPVWQGLKEG